jgi:hypothetical protein
MSETMTPSAERVSAERATVVMDEYRSVLIAYQRVEPNAKITAMLTDLMDRAEERDALYEIAAAAVSDWYAAYEGETDPPPSMFAMLENAMVRVDAGLRDRLIAPHVAAAAPAARPDATEER